MYTVYALSDPRTGAVCYVGVTEKPIEIRLRGHIAEALRGDTSSAERLAWLLELDALGLRPRVEALEIHTSDGGFWSDVAAKWDAWCAEKEWIWSMRDRGEPMTNVTPKIRSRQVFGFADRSKAA